MKYTAIIGIIIILGLFGVFGTFNANTNKVQAEDFLRIHIRANSNSTSDQLVKYEVKNSVVNEITKYLVNCNSKKEVVNEIKAHKADIEKIANKVLMSNNFSYGASLAVTNEYFPTRVYEDVVLESGYYDSIIINLGSAKGNNWWCVAYPPLCFVSEGSGANIVYKSKLVEIIKNFFE